MEYIPGITLSEKLAARVLPEKEVIRLGTQLAEGLSAAHEHGVIHRDLKPGNLRLTEDGRLKILDFGLAKLHLPVTASTTTETEAHGLAGTLPYMAPEQLLAGDIDARADIHAAGCVIYEMATGRRPFSEVERSKLIGAILTSAPVPAAAVNPGLSKELGRIIDKCLENDPENRYQSAKELAIDLRRLQMGAPSGMQLAANRLGESARKTIGIAAGILGLVILLVTTFNVGSWRDRVLGRGEARRIESLAVLPLANLSGDPQQDYFADGMTEELITNLGQLGALRVISRTSVMQYKQTKKTLPKIAQELGVDAVVEGSVLRSGDRVRITAQLIQAKPERHLWAESYDRDLRDVLTLQNEVARAVASEIRVRLTTQQQKQLVGAHPVNVEAYEAYLMGRHFLNSLSAEGPKKSLGFFEKAIQIDPIYAAAYAGLADAYILGASGLPPRQAMPKAKAAARKALELDAKVVEGHISLGLVGLVYDWDWPFAAKELQRAIALNPNDAAAHQWYAIYLATMGRLDKALAEITMAQQLDPLSLVMKELTAETLYFARHYDEAVTLCRTILELDPNNAGAHGLLSLIYQQENMFDQAANETVQVLTLTGDKKAADDFAQTYKANGYRNAKLQLIDDLKRRRSTPPFAIAADYAFLGNKNQALEWLEKAFNEKSPGQVTLKVDPRLDRLRSDPRFQDLLHRMNFPR